MKDKLNSIKNGAKVGLASCLASHSLSLLLFAQSRINTQFAKQVKELQAAGSDRLTEKRRLQKEKEAKEAPPPKPKPQPKVESQSVKKPVRKEAPKRPRRLSLDGSSGAPKREAKVEPTPVADSGESKEDALKAAYERLRLGFVLKATSNSKGLAIMLVRPNMSAARAGSSSAFHSQSSVLRADPFRVVVTACTT